MTDVVLHIGLAKTGTTALQETLVLNRPWLAERGWCYPVPDDGRNNHNGLVDGLTDVHLAAATPLRGRLRTDRLCDLLDQIDDRGGHGILSAEMFPVLVEADIERLADLLGHHDVTVAVHLRRPDELLRSLWVQLIGMLGTTEPFPVFVRNRMAREASLADFAILLAPWRQVFGDQAVVPLLYDSATNIPAFFGRWFGTSEGAVVPAPINASRVSRLVLEGLRRMAFHVGHLDPDVRVALGNQARQVPITKGWFGEPFQPLTRDLARDVLEHYRDRNAELAQTYFGRADLFPEAYATLDRLPASISPLEDEVAEESLHVFELAAVMMRRYEQMVGNRTTE